MSQYYIDWLSLQLVCWGIEWTSFRAAAREDWVQGCISREG